VSRSEPVRRGLAVSRRTVIKGRCLVVVVAVGAAVLDQAGKRILAVHAAGAVVGPVSVVLTHNAGVAFGIMAGHPALAKVLDLGLTVLLLALAMRLSGQASTVTRVLWGLLLGGALGNAADRVGPAGVVDWLRVAGYPAAFNLADLFVRLAAVGLVISFLGRASGATRRDARLPGGSASRRAGAPPPTPVQTKPTCSHDHRDDDDGRPRPGAPGAQVGLADAQRDDGRGGRAADPSRLARRAAAGAAAGVAAIIRRCRLSQNRGMCALARAMIQEYRDTSNARSGEQLT